jgi:hypothetical protein
MQMAFTSASTYSAAVSPSLKRSPTLSFTDAEYEKLGTLATAACLGRSEYIIDRLELDK